MSSGGRDTLALFTDMVRRAQDVAPEPPRTKGFRRGNRPVYAIVDEATDFPHVHHATWSGVREAMRRAYDRVARRAGLVGPPGWDSPGRCTSEQDPAFDTPGATPTYAAWGWRHERYKHTMRTL